MGFLGGCCKLTGAAAAVPAAVIVAALLEAPTVLEVSPDMLEGRAPAVEDAVAAAAPAASSRAADGEAAFGTAIMDGMGSGGMFDKIAFAYDVTNKWMSLGLDQFWRTTLIQDCMVLEKDDRVLDLATGTADVSILAGSRLRELGSTGEAVTGLDPSAQMLKHGVAKVEDRGLKGVVRLVKGDAQDLGEVRGIDRAGAVAPPTAGVASHSIDKISMSFGIRNVPNRSLAFREMKRVLRPKETSRVCILEFSLPDGQKFLSRVAKWFITQAVPAIGRIATFNSGSVEYEYLEKSIMKFPQPLDFAASMAEDGLQVKSITSFAYGAVHLYSAALSR